MTLTIHDLRLLSEMLRRVYSKAHEDAITTLLTKIETEIKTREKRTA